MEDTQHILLTEGTPIILLTEAIRHIMAGATTHPRMADTIARHLTTDINTDKRIVSYSGKSLIIFLIEMLLNNSWNNTG